MISQSGISPNQIRQCGISRNVISRSGSKPRISQSVLLICTISKAISFEKKGSINQVTPLLINFQVEALLKMKNPYKDRIYIDISQQFRYTKQEEVEYNHHSWFYLLHQVYLDCHLQCFQAWTVIPIGVDGVQIYIIKSRTEMCS